MIAMQRSIGTRVGRYEIVAELGRGAMGAVYAAKDPKIDRLVAIKTICLLGQEPQDESEYRERFFLEAQAAGRLSHPGIVTIFDVGEEPESREPYIVMEYVAGQSLSKLLGRENGKLPAGVVLRLAQELAEALHYAHAQGVVHRDIKPANILVTREGRAKIADFGIAKLNMAHMTLPGEVLGSPAYMAPEQLRGEGVDSRSDLFSLGVVLYTMLTGFLPFQGNSATTVCFKVVNRDPVPVSAFDAELPPELDQIVRRAMAKEPSERYQSGAEMAREIDELRQRDKATRNEEYLLPSIVTEIVSPVAKSSQSGQSAVNLRPSQSSAGATERSFVTAHLSFANETKAPASTTGSAQRTGGVARTSFLSRLRAECQQDRVLATALAVGILATGALYVGWVGFHAHRNTSRVAAPVLVQAAAEPQKLSSQRVAEVEPRPAPAVVRVSEPEKWAHPAAKAADLQIDISHPFAQGKASIWLDRKLVFVSQLRGEDKSHALLFRTIEGSEHGDLHVMAGEHQIHVRVQAASDQYDQSKTVDAKLMPGAGNVLHVICDKHHDVLQLTVQ
jgi:serine/threonine protein kinase